jgi:TP901 family phage tail tape measure protein
MSGSGANVTGELVVHIRVDDRALDQGLRRAENKVRTAGTHFAQTFRRAGPQQWRADWLTAAKTVRGALTATGSTGALAMRMVSQSATAMSRSIRNSLLNLDQRAFAAFQRGAATAANALVGLDVRALAMARNVRSALLTLDQRAFAAFQRGVSTTVAALTTLDVRALAMARNIRNSLLNLDQRAFAALQRGARTAEAALLRLDLRALAMVRNIRNSLLNLDQRAFAAFQRGVRSAEAALLNLDRRALAAVRGIRNSLLNLDQRAFAVLNRGMVANLRSVGTAAATAARAVLSIGTAARRALNSIGGLRTGMRNLTTFTDPQTGETTSIGRYLSRDLLVLGGVISAAITRPLVRASREAINVANETLDEINRIVLLTVATMADIPRVTDSVVRAVRESGLTAADAARGLFFLTSGLGDVNLAMSAMVPLSRATAIGIGTFEEAARSVVTVLKNYGEENISVAETLDILSVAAERSVALPAEVGAALQKAVPAAAQLGIEFGELASFTALLTPSFASASETGTAVNRMIIELMRGIPKMRSEFEALRPGFTSILGPMEDNISVYSRFREEIQEKGLIPSLQLMKQAMDAQNIAAGEQASILARLFGRQTSFRAAMAFMRISAADVALTVDAVAESAGNVIKQYDIWTETARGRWTLAMEGLRGTQFLVGQELQGFFVPILENLTGTVGTLLEAWLDMPGAMRFVIGAFGAMLAAMGPVIVAYGTLGLMTSITTIHHIPSLVRALTLAKFAFGAVGTAALAVSAIFAGRALGTFIGERFLGFEAVEMAQFAERLDQLSNAARDAQLAGEGFEIGFDSATGKILLQGAANLNVAEKATEELHKSMRGLDSFLKTEGIIDLAPIIGSTLLGGDETYFSKGIRGIAKSLQGVLDPLLRDTRRAFTEVDNVVANLIRQDNLPAAARQFAIFGLAVQNHARGVLGFELDMRSLIDVFPEVRDQLALNNIEFEDFLEILNETVRQSEFLQSALSLTAQEINHQRQNVQLLRQDYVDLHDTMSGQFNIFKQYRDTQARLNELMEAQHRFDPTTGALSVWEKQGKELVDVTDEFIEKSLLMPGIIAQITSAGGFNALTDNIYETVLAITGSETAARGLEALLKNELPAAYDAAVMTESLLEPGITRTLADLDRLFKQFGAQGGLEPFRLFEDEFGRRFGSPEIFTGVVDNLDEMLDMAVQSTLFQVEEVVKDLSAGIAENMSMDALGDAIGDSLEEQAPKVNTATDAMLVGITHRSPGSAAREGPLSMSEGWPAIMGTGAVIAEVIAAGMRDSASIVNAGMDDMLRGMVNFDAAGAEFDELALKISLELRMAMLRQRGAIRSSGQHFVRQLIEGMGEGVATSRSVLDAFAITITVELSLSLIRQRNNIRGSGHNFTRILVQGMSEGVDAERDTIHEMIAVLAMAIRMDMLRQRNAIRETGFHFTRMLIHGMGEGVEAERDTIHEMVLVLSMAIRMDMLRQRNNIRSTGQNFTRMLGEGMLEGARGERDTMHMIAVMIALDLRMALIRQRASVFMAGENLTRSLAEGIRRGITHVETAIRDLEAAINRSIGSMQIDGSSITRRLASGIRSGSGSVNTAMDDTLVGINDRLPSSPARLGPLSGAGDPLLAGREIVNRLIEGMRDREVGLSSAFSQVLTPLGNAGDLRLPVSTAGGVGGGTSSTSTSLDQSLNFGGITVVAPDPRAAGRAVVTEVSDTVYLSTGRVMR